MPANDSIGTATIDVSANTTRLESRVNATLNKISGRKINADFTAFTPLGRISKDASQVERSLEAANARVLAFGASAGVFALVSAGLKKVVTDTINVEKSLLDINVILGASSSRLKEFSGSLFEIAKNTGQSFDTAAEAAKEFSRQGLSLEDTLKRTNAALVLTRISGLDGAKSVTALTTAINSFNKEALTQEDIVNRLANIDAKFAVSSEDLVNSLSVAGAAAQGAKVSLNEFLAIVTSVKQSTGQSGNQIANALKGIFVRTGRSDTLDELESIGVAARDAAGNTLPMVQILQNLANVQDNLSDSQKAFVSDLTAGTYRVNQLRAALGDISKANGIYARSLKVANSESNAAFDRSDQLNKSLAAQANAAKQNATKLFSDIGTDAFGPALKNIFSTFNKLVDSNAIGSDIGKSIVSGIGNAISGPGLVAIFALLGKTFGRFFVNASQAFSSITGLNKNFEKINSTLGKIVSRETASVNKEKEKLNIIQAQNAALQKQASLSGRVGNRLSSISGSNLAFGGGFALSAIGGLAGSETQAGRRTSGIASSIGSGLVGGALIGGGPGAAVGGLIAVFGSLKTVLDNITPSFEELAKKIDDTNAKYTEQINAANEFVQATSGLEDLIKSGASSDIISKANQRVSRSRNNLPLGLQNELSGVVTSGRQIDITQKFNARREDLISQGKTDKKLLAVSENNTFLGVSSRNRQALDDLSKSGLGKAIAAGLAAVPGFGGLGSGLLFSGKTNSFGDKNSADALFNQLSESGSKNLKSSDLERINKEFNRNNSLDGIGAALEKITGASKETIKAFFGTAESQDAAVFSAKRFILSKITEAKASEEAGKKAEKAASGFRDFSKNISLLISNTSNANAIKINREQLNSASSGRISGALNQANEQFTNPISQINRASNIESRGLISGNNATLSSLQEQARKLIPGLSGIDFGKDNLLKSSIAGQSNKASTSDDPIKILTDIRNALFGSSQTRQSKEFEDFNEKLTEILTEQVKANDTLKSQLETLSAISNIQKASALANKITSNFGGLGALSNQQDLSQISSGRRANFQNILERDNPRFQANKNLELQYSSDPNSIRNRNRQTSLARSNAIGRGIIDSAESGELPSALEIGTLRDGDQKNSLTKFLNSQRNKLASSFFDDANNRINKSAGNVISDLQGSIGNQYGGGDFSPDGTFKRAAESAQAGNLNEVEKQLRELLRRSSPGQRGAISGALSEIQGLNSQKGFLGAASDLKARSIIPTGDNENGPLSKKGLIEALGLFFPKNPSEQPKAQLAGQREELGKSFERISNSIKNGSIRGNSAIINAVGATTNDTVRSNSEISAKVEVAIRNQDINGDGTVSTDELEEFRKKMEVYIKEYFESGGNPPPRVPATK